jgi:hypothetical protein
MPVKRRRYPGDPRGGPPKPVPPRKPDKVDTYTVFWKDTEDRQKGTIWLCLSRELIRLGRIKRDEDIPLWVKGQRRSLILARGKKWYAIYSEEEEYMYLASPMATKKVMADIVSRWENPPLRLRPANGPAFALSDLRDETHSHVYLVQLLTFHQTREGKLYYKIGKAKSIPKRIKQFGPCRLVASIKLPTEQASLRAESELHVMFAHLRRPDTEIFCMDETELQAVVAECSRHMQDVSE